MERASGRSKQREMIAHEILNSLGDRFDETLYGGRGVIRDEGATRTGYPRARHGEPRKLGVLSPLGGGRQYPCSRVTERAP